MDISSERHKKSQEILKDSAEDRKIKWICGQALDSLKSIETEGPFDMVFIDADKEAYLEYLDWAEKHLKTGGLLAADNTFLFGAVYGESERSPQPKTIEIMKEFNRRLAGDSCWERGLAPYIRGTYCWDKAVKSLEKSQLPDRACDSVILERIFCRNYTQTDFFSQIFLCSLGKNNERDPEFRKDRLFQN